ncbi:MAG: PAS domain S-box protein [Proteobacteria bacterium]|nr:PAS domain S-box protein [Pseudomonadota bacterium]
MTQTEEQRRKDDDIRQSKTELLSELQISHRELEKQNHELKETQQQLNESHKRYADLYEYAPVGFLTLNKTGHILSLNQAGAKLLRNNRESLIGKLFTDCFFDIDHQAFIQYLQKVFTTSGKTAVDLKIKNADEQLSYIRLESTLMCDSSTCLMIMSDISQLKKAINLNRNLLHENRRLMKKLFHIQENERRLIARELHDELGQWLTAVRVENEVILNNTSSDSTVAVSARANNECIQKMNKIIHEMLHQLRPVLLDTLGLIGALSELKRQWCVRHPQTILEFKLSGELDKLNEPINIAVYRLIQEGLTNIYSHAEATWAQISLSREGGAEPADDCLLLTIEDNGKGYNINQQSSGLGLLGMRERVIAMSGTLSVRSAYNEGTEITIKLPIEHSNYDETNLYPID